VINYSLVLKLIGGVLIVIPLLFASVNHMVEAKYSEVSVRIDGLEQLEETRAEFIRDGVIEVRTSCNSIEARLGRIEALLYRKLGE